MKATSIEILYNTMYENMLRSKDKVYMNVKHFSTVVIKFYSQLQINLSILHICIDLAISHIGINKRHALSLSQCRVLGALYPAIFSDLLFNNKAKNSGHLNLSPQVFCCTFIHGNQVLGAFRDMSRKINLCPRWFQSLYLRFLPPKRSSATYVFSENLVLGSGATCMMFYSLLYFVVQNSTIKKLGMRYSRYLEGKSETRVLR